MPSKSRVGVLFETQWFSLSLVVLFALAWALPAVAGAVGLGGWTKSAAVILIFFLSGLSLRTREALDGLANWRLHLFIQGFSFVFTPVVCWLALRPFQHALPHGLLVGFYVLSVLPITITTCVVFTQLAGGSFAGALFNSVFANIAGVFIAPGLLLLMIGTSELSVKLDALGTFLKLGRLILAPLVVGQIVRLMTGGRLRKLSGASSVINRCCVLLIVYLAFGETFADNTFRDNVARVAGPLALLVPAHLVILWLAWAGGGWLKFGRADRIAAVFCAPQKTLALGLPLVAALLAKSPELMGLASLPIIVYHPVQLLAGGLLVDRLKKPQPAAPAGEDGLL
jgi:sodium/bile acid cotransporter 7